MEENPTNIPLDGDGEIQEETVELEQPNEEIDARLTFALAMQCWSVGFSLNLIHMRKTYSDIVWRFISRFGHYEL